jgi:hypothetical protein
MSSFPKSASSSATFSTVASATHDPTQAGLLHQSDLTYLGAFRVPGGNIGASTFGYGGTALTYNPANNSLFAVGHPYDQAIAEIKIPATIHSGSLGSLTTATVLQPFVKVLNRIPTNPGNMSSGGNEFIGGLLVSNGQLICTAYNTYDADNAVTLSHFKLSSLALSSASVTGLFQLGSLGGGFVGGYMTPIPPEWQTLLGAPALTGQAAINIITRTSYGPAAFGFNPATLGAGVNPIIPYVYYDQHHTTLGAWDSNPPTTFNGTCGGDNNTGFGVAFVPGTRSVLYFGAIGTGNFYYGEASGAGDTNRTDKGVHSVGGNYIWQVWAYDANDFLAAKQGTKNPWQPVPYTTWNFTLSPDNGDKYMGGCAYDPAAGRLYFSELGADNADGFFNGPLIHVWQLAPQSPPPTHQFFANSADTATFTGAATAIDLRSSGVRIVRPFFGSPGGGVASPGLLTFGSTVGGASLRLFGAADSFTFTDAASGGNSSRARPKQASDGFKFSDLAYRNRSLIVSASDSAAFFERASGLDSAQASDSFVFGDFASVSLYLGRYRVGDYVSLSFDTPSPPDFAPVVVITDANNAQIASFAVASTTRDKLEFGLPLFVSTVYHLGTFQVYFHYTIAGASALNQATFDVVAGGDSGGAVISLHGVDRPEARSIIAQLASGRLVLGSNPAL